MSLDVTSGGTAADSYATVTEANDYFTARGVTAWTGTDTVKENALRRATSYLDNQYRGRWAGVRTNEAQALAWPRINGFRDYSGGVVEPLYDIDGFQIASDVVPTQIKRAQIEAALLVIGGATLEPTVGRDVKSKTVGPLSVTYMDSAAQVNRYTAIEGLLRGLVTGTPGSTSGAVKLVRA